MHWRRHLTIFKVLWASTLTISIATLWHVSKVIAGATDYTDPTSYPAAWPTNAQWKSYTFKGQAIGDGGGSNDTSTGGTTPNGAADIVSPTGQASVFVYGDGNNLYFRMRLDDTPLQTTGTGQPFGSGSWSLLLDTDGDGYKEFILQLNGSDGGSAPDDLIVLYNNSNNQAYDASTDTLWRQDSAKHPTSPNTTDGETGNASNWDSDNSASVTNYARTRVVETTDYANQNNKKDYFLDVQIPLAALDATSKGGPKITSSSVFGLAYSTANSNSNPAQKDFVGGGNGTYTLNSTNNPLPFGDPVNGSGTITTQPTPKKITLGSQNTCTSATVSADVVAPMNIVTVGGQSKLMSSVQKVEFYRYVDSNANGQADDSQSWVSLGTVTQSYANSTITVTGGTVANNINPWTMTFNPSTLANKNYLIKAIAYDDQNNVVDSSNSSQNAAGTQLSSLDNQSCGAVEVTVSGQVRNDSNSNGDLVEADSGISGVTVKLYQNDGNGNPTGTEIALATTDSSGNYSFPNIVAGNYVIVETNSANFASSGDSQGANDDKIAVSVGTVDKTGNIFLDVDTTLLDYGDAPNTYSTLSASSGASHIRNGTLFLGSGVTGETDGQPNATATGDTYDDGITFSPSLGVNYSTLIQAGISNTANLVSSSSGFVNAWVDYNQDGDFNDSGEQIFINQSVTAGTNALSFPTPPPNTILHGLTMARFRLSPASIASPSVTGQITGGEVEDYQVNVAAPVPDGAACATTGLLNGSFEQPLISGSTPFLQEFVNSTIRTYDEKNIPGWNTTATDNGIELWTNGTDAGNGITPAFQGEQFAEINANQQAALFQDIATTPGSTINWRFAHRGRAGTDTLALKIGPTNASVLQSNYSTGNTGWALHQGTYVVPAGQYITRFQFEAVSTASGSQTVGNFIDGVQFSTSDCVTPISPPTVDLDQNNSSGATGNNYNNNFVVAGGAVAAADADVSITDDKTAITKATITLTNRPDGNSESLSIDATAGGTISGVTAVAYNSSTGKLILSGSATLADYQTIIATLKYNNTATSPDLTNRAIYVQVTDSDSLQSDYTNSNRAVSIITMLKPPTIDLDGDNNSGATGNDYKNNFTAGNGPISAADTDVVITDEKANIKAATITLTNRPDSTAESLSIDATAGGTVLGVTAVAYNATTGQLTLSGTTTLANYQKIIATLKYNNTAASPNTANRIINVQVTDSDNLTSNTAISTIIQNTAIAPAFLLVKRITGINGQVDPNGLPRLDTYNPDPGNPYDDNEIEPSLAPNPPNYPSPDTDKWPNTTQNTASTFLLGRIDGGAVKPTDEVEYTIYFLSSGTATAKDVQICDRIPDHQTFVPDAFNTLTPSTGGIAGTDRGISVLQNGANQSFTNIGGDDTAQFYPPGSVLPDACNGAIPQSEDNGAVVVNLGDLPQATGPVTSPNSYGFVRFRVKVK